MKINPMNNELLKFANGEIKQDTLSRILNQLPLEIDFVDENDNFKYFANTEHKVFPRDNSQLGKNVVSLHPGPMQDKVTKIMKSFHDGTSTQEEFWLPIHGKFVYIQYQALHDDDGKYLGCFEISGDITHLREIEGMKGL